MNKAKRMFENARKEVMKVHKPSDFDAVDATQFTKEYCYTVFTSGFRQAIPGHTRLN